MTKEKALIIWGTTGLPLQWAKAMEGNNLVAEDKKHLTDDGHKRLGTQILDWTLDRDKDISYYNLRHTYATWRLYAGMNSRALCEKLGKINEDGSCSFDGSQLAPAVLDKMTLTLNPSFMPSDPASL